MVWWLIATVAAVVAVRVLVRTARDRRAVAAREADELAYRADRQNQWARREDSRGVYGFDGAELMREISPEPPLLESDDALDVAAVAGTADGLAALLADKATGWRWAAFASVLVQRRAAVRSRRAIRGRPDGGAV